MENEKTAQTNLEAGAENVQDLGAKDSTASQTVDKEHSTDAAAMQNTDSEGFEFTDGAKKSEEAEREAIKKQNSENARRRRAAEREAELSKMRLDTVIEVTGGVNPFTDEPIEDEEDVKEYLLMKKIEREGGDPLSDYSRFKRGQRKKEQAETQQDEKQREWYVKDRESFAKKYPKVDIAELVKNERFADYAEGKVGVKPLSEIYEGFMKFDTAAVAEQKRAAQALANSKAATGPLSTAQSTESDFFTKEQVDKMSYEEVKKNYDKIIKSMKKWKQ